MKLWDVLIRCLFLLSTVSTNPLFSSLPSANRPLERFPDIPLPQAEEPRSKSHTESVRTRGPFISEPYAMAGPSYPEKQDDVMSFIAATIRRLRRSSDRDGSSWAWKERERQRRAGNGKRRGRGGNRKGRGQRGGGGSHGGKGGRGRSRGCVLKQIHLNVTDLGLGYRTKEELIFRYCSGPCIDSETNYDKILNNLTHNKKLDQEKPSRTCCRPIAFDDDLSFLDDNLVYHTLKKHSARKCGCV